MYSVLIEIIRIFAIVFFAIASAVGAIVIHG